MKPQRTLTSSRRLTASRSRGAILRGRQSLMLILAIETSCDETAAAIIRDCPEILSNIVSSSASLHEKYGGIIPEMAAREQVKCIVPVIDEALRFADTNLEK